MPISILLLYAVKDISLKLVLKKNPPLKTDLLGYKLLYSDI